MTTLIKDIDIIPMTKEGLIIHSDILIEDGIIKRIEKDINEKADKTIDGKKKILLPAFINTHTHLAMTLMRNYKDEMPNLESWLKEVWKAEDEIRDGELYWPSILGIAELYKSGTVTFSDMYFYPWDTAKAVRDAKGRALLGVTLFGGIEETEKRLKESVPRLEESFEGYEGLSYSISPHAIYTTDKKTLEEARDFVLKNSKIIHIHISETQKEVDDSLNEFSKTPLEYVDSIGLLEAKTAIAHGVYLTPKEIALAAVRKASILHCPISNAKLSSGYAPVALYREYRVNVAMGTDGASSNNNLNMLKEINSALLLHNLVCTNPNSLKPYNILEMATVNGAKALNMDKRIGTVEVGKEADLLILDLNKTNTAPINNVFSAIVFSASTDNVDTLLSQGIPVLENGRLTTIDEKEAILNTAEIWKEIKGRIKN